MNRIAVGMIVLAFAMPAQAAAGQPDDFIGVAFWVFVAYCALIIVPHAIRALIATLRSPRKEEETPAEVTENVTE